MSQSPTESNRREPVGAYRQGWQEMTRLIETGGSWSGRERHCCLLNTGDGPFADISSISGLDFLDDGRGIATVDWDLDGKLDLWITSRGAPGIRFLHNEIDSQPGYLSVLLVGKSCNRDAIGARVQLDLTDGRSLTRTLHAGDAFLSQSSKWIHFGLGNELVKRLEVHWPSGDVQSFDNVAPNRRYEIVQGSDLLGSPQGIARKIGEADSTASAAAQADAASDSVRRVLLERVPLPKLTAASFEEESRPLGSAEQGLHLINLWAAWCAPCLGELKEFGARHSELQQAGVTISALSVDGLVGDEESSPARAMEVVQRLQLPFSTGIASKELLDKLDVVQDVVTTRKTTIDDAFSFAVPTSFLVDEAGRICVIYQGTIELDRLLADAALIRAGELQATPFAGRWFLEPRDATGILVRFADRFLRRGYPTEAQRYIGLAAALAGRRTSDLTANRLVGAVYNDLGNHFDRKRDSANAETHYLLALQADSQSPQAHNNLGDVYYRRGEYDAARTHFNEALRNNPNLIQAHMNLAAIDFTQGKLDEALNGFRRALQIDPQFAVAHNYLGLVLAKKGDYADASFHFSEAIKLDPGYSDAAENLRSMRAMME